jgi:hypothetical protein
VCRLSAECLGQIAMDEGHAIAPFAPSLRKQVLQTRQESGPQAFVSVAKNLMERVDKGLRLLRPGERWKPIDDEERHAVQTAAASFSFLGQHFVAALDTLKKTHGLARS